MSQKKFYTVCWAQIQNSILDYCIIDVNHGDSPNFEKDMSDPIFRINTWPFLPGDRGGHYNRLTIEEFKTKYGDIEYP